MPPVVVVHDLDGFPDQHLEFGGQDLHRFTAVEPLARAGVDHEAVVGCA